MIMTKFTNLIKGDFSEYEKNQIRLKNIEGGTTNKIQRFLLKYMLHLLYYII